MRPANAAPAWRCIARSTGRRREVSSKLPICSSTFAARLSTTRRSVTARASPMRQRARLPMTPSAPISCSATSSMRAAVGASRPTRARVWRWARRRRPPTVRPWWSPLSPTPVARGRRAPRARTRRMLRAPAIPAPRFTAGASSGSCDNSAWTAFGRGAEIEELLDAHHHRADHRRERGRHFDLERKAGLRERHARSSRGASPIATVRR